MGLNLYLPNQKIEHLVVYMKNPLDIDILTDIIQGEKRQPFPMDEDYGCGRNDGLQIAIEIIKKHVR